MKGRDEHPNRISECRREGKSPKDKKIKENSFLDGGEDGEVKVK